MSTRATWSVLVEPVLIRKGFLIFMKLSISSTVIQPSLRFMYIDMIYRATMHSGVVATVSGEKLNALCSVAGQGRVGVFIAI